MTLAMVDIEVRLQSKLDLALEFGTFDYGIIFTIVVIIIVSTALRRKYEFEKNKFLQTRSLWRS